MQCELIDKGKASQINAPETNAEISMNDEWKRRKVISDIDCTVLVWLVFLEGVTYHHILKPPTAAPRKPFIVYCSVGEASH